MLRLYFLLWLIAAVVASQGDFYDSDANIYELTPSTFDKVVHKSNYTTIVEFYAPWCGYCKQLKPVYQKLGKFIQQDSKYGVNVAAVNCDKNYNKQLCAEQQVSGFPTLKVFRPPKYDSSNKPKGPTKHIGEVYQGERGFKSLVNFLNSRIKNYVKKLHSADSVNKWINGKGHPWKVLLLTNSNTVSPMFKTMGIDFLNSVSFGYLTVKDHFDSESLSVGDETVPVPISKEEKYPVILLIDTESKTIEKYNSNTKINDKLKLSQWLIEKTKSVPIEGELSKKDQEYYSNYRMGKKGKKIVKDEL